MAKMHLRWKSVVEKRDFSRTPSNSFNKTHLWMTDQTLGRWRNTRWTFWFCQWHSGERWTYGRGKDHWMVKERIEIDWPSAATVFTTIWIFWILNLKTKWDAGSPDLILRCWKQFADVLITLTGGYFVIARKESL